MSSAPPRVSIVLPTFNRAEGLERAIGSALRQTYRDVELVIADNASTDTTPELCARIAATDERVRVIRRPSNLGLTANFNSVLAEARGELVMVLADDDWIAPDYVELLVSFLEAHPDHVLVSGSARYHDAGGEERGRGVDVACEQHDPAERVRWFFGHVVDNAAIYGLIRTAHLRGALPMANALAGDWMLIGRLLMAGRLGVVPGATLHRSVGGTSASYGRTAQSMGLTRSEERRPHLAMARLVRRDVESHRAYAELTRSERRRLGRACAYRLLRARPLDVLDDLLGPLLRLPGLRRVDRALRGAVRRARPGARPYLP